jgi:recombination protein RecA
MASKKKKENTDELTSVFEQKQASETETETETETPVDTEVSTKVKAKKPAPVKTRPNALELTEQYILAKLKKKPLELENKQYPHIPTGSMVVDDLIGGSLTPDGDSICPGFPRRRIIEIFGPESSGKTTLALGGIAQVQKRGGTAVFLDFEHALHRGYAESIGVSFDPKKLKVYAPDDMEQGFAILYTAIASGVDLVVVDSVAAMVPKKELVKKFDESAAMGITARKMSEVLPKIVTWLGTLPGKEGVPHEGMPGTSLILLNQERATISSGPSYGAPTPSSAGGKALKFYSSIRLYINKIRNELIEKKDMSTAGAKPKKVPYGTLTQVKVVKNKLDGKNGHSGNIFIRYGFGIDDLYSLIETATAFNIVKRQGAYYTYGDTRISGRDKFRAFLQGNTKICQELKKKVRTEMVLVSKPIADEDVKEDSEFTIDVDGAFEDTEVEEVEVENSEEYSE